VHAMGGKIWVESSLGEGSRFHFTARFGVADAPVEANRATNVVLAGTPVLVVDDNLTNRRVLTGLLSRWGMRPTAAASAEEAILLLRRSVLQQDPFNLVLTDVHMPGTDGFHLAGLIMNTPDLAEPLIVMLTSGEQRGDAARCRELGVAAYLVKPIRRAELWAAILNALERRPEPNPGIPQTENWTQPSVAEHHTLSRAKVRILLAEDNAVNRRVVCRILEKAGYDVVAVADGKEALKRLRAGSFDLVLMDIQMPDMDGFEATRAIRQQEKQTADHIPIIALTAHALSSDREHCLEAGADDYITKPINARSFLNLVEKHCRGFAPNRNRQIPLPDVVE